MALLLSENNEELSGDDGERGRTVGTVVPRTPRYSRPAGLPRSSSRRLGRSAAVGSGSPLRGTTLKYGVDDGFEDAFGDTQGDALEQGPLHDTIIRHARSLQLKNTALEQQAQEFVEAASLSGRSLSEARMALAKSRAGEAKAHATLASLESDYATLADTNATLKAVHQRCFTDLKALQTVHARVVAELENITGGDSSGRDNLEAKVRKRDAEIRELKRTVKEVSGQRDTLKTQLELANQSAPAFGRAASDAQDLKPSETLITSESLNLRTSELPTSTHRDDIRVETLTASLESAWEKLRGLEDENEELRRWKRDQEENDKESSSDLAGPRLMSELGGFGCGVVGVEISTMTDVMEDLKQIDTEHKCMQTIFDGKDIELMMKVCEMQVIDDSPPVVESPITSMIAPSAEAAQATEDLDLTPKPKPVGGGRILMRGGATFGKSMGEGLAGVLASGDESLIMESPTMSRTMARKKLDVDSLFGVKNAFLDLDNPMDISELKMENDDEEDEEEEKSTPKSKPRQILDWGSLADDVDNLNDETSMCTSDTGTESDGGDDAVEWGDLEILGNDAIDKFEYKDEGVECLTKTMIGSWFFKYTRHQTKHLRFFWIHPYNSTLNWSSTPPTSRTKGPLHLKSLVISSISIGPLTSIGQALTIHSPSRNLRIVPQTPEDLTGWYRGVQYLVERRQGHKTEDLIKVVDVDEWESSVVDLRKTLRRSVASSRESLKSDVETEIRSRHQETSKPPLIHSPSKAGKMGRLIGRDRDADSQSPRRSSSRNSGTHSVKLSQDEAFDVNAEPTREPPSKHERKGSFGQLRRALSFGNSTQ